MKFSIVTISFNQAPFLERALLSVLDQDYKDVEYIVVDAGSVDGSRDLLEKYRSRLAHLILEKDAGPADGLNKGFSRAMGDICGYINADDAFLPGAFTRAVDFFRTRRDVDVVSAHGYMVGESGRVLRRFRSSPFDAWRYVYGGGVVMQQSTFFRRPAFLAAGGFNIANHTCWDGELMVDMALAGKRFAVVDDYWSLFRIHPASLSGSQRALLESRRNWDRLFTKVTGRNRQPHDLLIRLGVRAEKWLRDPATPILRLADMIHPPALPPGAS